MSEQIVGLPRSVDGRAQLGGSVCAQQGRKGVLTRLWKEHRRFIRKRQIGVGQP
jgi:hypothetical protein